MLVLFKGHVGTLLLNWSFWDKHDDVQICVILGLWILAYLLCTCAPSPARRRPNVTSLRQNQQPSVNSAARRGVAQRLAADCGPPST